MIHSVSKTFTGNGTNTIGSNIRGKILSVRMTSDSSVTNNWDIALTGSVSGVPILTDTAIANNTTEYAYPRALINKVADGSAATAEYVEIPLVDEAITCVTTNAGTTGEITIEVIIETDNP